MTAFEIGSLIDERECDAEPTSSNHSFNNFS